ncbi:MULTISPECIES: hypothetical protein [unclassified Yoonia]|uniref:hypothetical protein n=1 Tax=unclassified Yoonia TaxID=2629118 RepID=UPI002AFF776F|nr:MULTISPECIES: hypothetical protein [unclassified Yoonia]
MSDNRQILDVTYGTFSCRLEGFEDSVATMKLVAEYLHNLSDQGHITDRSTTASDMAALAALTGGSVEDVGTSDGKVQLRLRKYDAEPATSPNLRQDLAVTQDDADEDNDSVAAKLDRIRAVVGRGAVKAADDDFTEDLPTPEQPRTGMTPLAQRLADLALRKAGLIDTAPPHDDGKTDDDPAEKAGGDTADQPETAQDVKDESAPAAEPLSDDSTMNPALWGADDDLNLQDDLAEGGRASDDRQKRQAFSRSADESIQRILSQTDDHLNAPELRRQRDSFAQLKAASVAIDAARQLGDETDSNADINDAYREDFDDIAATQSAEPAPQAAPVQSDLDATDQYDDLTRPLVLTAPIAPSPLPPLRLVASQRVVDPIIPTDGAEERLRRIVSRIEGKTVDPVTYPEFVAHHSVTEVEEMILAAAAYVNFVEGKQDFSRPEVMRLVRAHAPDAVARENGVRMFGRLVSEERIIRLDNGRFQAAPDTPYRPDSKVARG